MYGIIATIGSGSQLAAETGFGNGVSAGRLIYSPYQNHLFPSLGEKAPLRGAFEGGSHFAKIRHWLPGVSAGQGIYSPHEVHLFPYTGYHFCSHLLATNWLPPGEACFPDVATRDCTSRTRQHEMDGFSGFATVEWE